MSKDQSSRRDFLKSWARRGGAVIVGGVAYGLVNRADADKVWQLDPTVCTACKGLIDPHSIEPDGWGFCASDCVLKLSAVKAVNDFPDCGYCFICPGYYDTSSEKLDDQTYTGFICPVDAIVRKLVGLVDEYDTLNNCYEYTIDESLCNGCGRCVEYCKPPWGNGSLRLEVRHSVCVDCNHCTIATACPVDAFFRSPAHGKRAGYGGSAPGGAKRAHT